MPARDIVDNRNENLLICTIAACGKGGGGDKREVYVPNYLSQDTPGLNDC